MQLAFFEGEILLGSQLLAEESMLFDQLDREHARRSESGRWSCASGSAAPSSCALREYSLPTSTRSRPPAGPPAMAAEANLPHVQFASVQMVASAYRGDAIQRSLSRVPRGAIGNAIALLREVDLLRQNNRLVSAGHINGVVRSLVDNVLANRYTMLQLTALRNYDEYTFFHSANVAVVCARAGCERERGPPVPLVAGGRRAAPRHRQAHDRARRSSNKPGPLDARRVGAGCASTPSRAPR